MTTPRIVEVRRNLLKKNDLAAAAPRDRSEAAGLFVISLVSSPGSGKTTFLEWTLTRMRQRHRVAALVGDLATDCDAEQLRRSGAPVRQIATGPSATSTPRWSGGRSRNGRSTTWTGSSSRTWGIWCARPATASASTSARSSGAGMDAWIALLAHRAAVTAASPRQA